MVHSIFVIEGKDEFDIKQNKDFETTNYTFHEFSQADNIANDLIENGTFKEIRIREYSPDEYDEGFILKEYQDE